MSLIPSAGSSVAVAKPPLGQRVWLGWTLAWGAIWSAIQVGPNLVALALSPTARTFWRWLRVWAGMVMGGAGIRVTGQGTAPSGAVVYVSNHQSMLDIPALTRGIPAPFVFVARAGLGSLPIVGAILRHSRCVLVDRSTAGGVERAMDEARERLESGESVLFFPEGTRSYGAEMRSFYPGAFRLTQSAGVPVVPVAVNGAWALINERQRTARPGVVSVRLGEPLPNVEGEGVGDLTLRAHDAVERLLDQEGLTAG